MVALSGTLLVIYQIRTADCHAQLLAAANRVTVSWLTVESFCLVQ